MNLGESNQGLRPLPPPLHTLFNVCLVSLIKKKKIDPNSVELVLICLYVFE